MKRILLTGIQQFELKETPYPELLNDNEVLLKINTVGVCGSDIHYYNEGRIGDQVIEFPFVIGHECSAFVQAVGKNVTRVKEGNLVAVEPALSCHKCEQCLSGREHTCTNLKFLGCPGQIEGCLSEYIILPEENCFKVPENINGEIAALVEPLSIAWYATEFLKDYKNKNNFSAAILGVGPIGLGVMLSLQGKGINDIYITDKLDYRLGIAKNAGAVWTGNPDKVDIVTDLKKLKIEGFDVVIECCGKQEAIDQAVEILKPGGLLLIVGIPENDRISFNISKIRRKEIVIQNVRRQNNATRHVIDLIAAGKLSPGFMITHRFNPEDTAKAFELVNSYDDGVIKAIIKF